MKLSIIAVAALASISSALPSIQTPMAEGTNICVTMARAAARALTDVNNRAFDVYVSQDDFARYKVSILILRRPMSVAARRQVFENIAGNCRRAAPSVATLRVRYLYLP